MVAQEGPHDPGRRVLGPHVVGQRVVVRRLLRGETGPSGGPAMTDLLGVCTAWGGGVCVVQPEAGEPVRIPISDIVSGKPVPPRPSPRLRVSPTEAQVRALALWPDVETRRLGAWVLRHSPTSTARRANSVLAFEPPGVEGAYDAVVAYYAATTGRPVAAVIPDSAEEGLFRGHGWDLEAAHADTVFEIAGVAGVRRAIGPAPADAPVAMVEAGDLVTARVEVGGEVVASGVAAFGRDWVGVRGLEVAPEHRRRGLGLAVMGALMGWGAERGATTAYLQVIADNEPALALYDRLGFRPHHTYRYLAPRSA